MLRLFQGQNENGKTSPVVDEEPTVEGEYANGTRIAIRCPDMFRLNIGQRATKDVQFMYCKIGGWYHEGNIVDSVNCVGELSYNYGTVQISGRYMNQKVLHGGVGGYSRVGGAGMIAI